MSSDESSAVKSKLYVFQCSLIESEREEERLKETIEKLGGQMDEFHGYSSRATHLIAGRDIASEKCMCFIATGKWILTEKYIDDCKEAGRFLPEEPYHISHFLPDSLISNASLHWMKQIDESRGNAPFVRFCGAFFMPEGEKTNAFIRLIKAGGGRAVHINAVDIEVNGTLSAVKSSADSLSDYSPIDFNVVIYEDTSRMSAEEFATVHKKKCYPSIAIADHLLFFEPSSSSVQPSSMPVLAEESISTTTTDTDNDISDSSTSHDKSLSSRVHENTSPTKKESSSLSHDHSTTSDDDNLSSSNEDDLASIHDNSSPSSHDDSTSKHEILSPNHNNSSSSCNENATPSHENNSPLSHDNSSSPNPSKLEALTTTETTTTKTDNYKTGSKISESRHENLEFNDGKSSSMLNNSSSVSHDNLSSIHEKTSPMQNKSSSPKISSSTSQENLTSKHDNPSSNQNQSASISHDKSLPILNNSSLDQDNSSPIHEKTSPIKNNSLSSNHEKSPSIDASPRSSNPSSSSVGEQARN